MAKTSHASMNLMAVQPEHKVSGHAACGRAGRIRRCDRSLSSPCLRSGNQSGLTGYLQDSLFTVRAKVAALHCPWKMLLPFSLPTSSQKQRTIEYLQTLHSWALTPSYLPSLHSVSKRQRSARAAPLLAPVRSSTSKCSRQENVKRVFHADQAGMQRKSAYTGIALKPNQLHQLT